MSNVETSFHIGHFLNSDLATASATSQPVRDTVDCNALEGKRHSARQWQLLLSSDKVQSLKIMESI